MSLSTQLDVSQTDAEALMQSITCTLKDMEQAFAAASTNLEKTAVIFQKKNVCQTIFELTEKLKTVVYEQTPQHVVELKNILYSVLTNVTAVCTPELHIKLAEAGVIRAIGEDLIQLHEEQKETEELGQVREIILYFMYTNTNDCQ